MDEIKLSGFCDLRFTKIKDLLEESLASGFDTGVSIAIEHKGEMVVNLTGGYKDLAPKKGIEKTMFFQAFYILQKFQIIKLL